jgi:hypothetical protein
MDVNSDVASNSMDKFCSATIGDYVCIYSVAERYPDCDFSLAPCFVLAQIASKEMVSYSTFCRDLQHIPSDEVFPDCPRGKGTSSTRVILTASSPSHMTDRKFYTAARGCVKCNKACHNTQEVNIGTIPIFGGTLPSQDISAFFVLQKPAIRELPCLPPYRNVTRQGYPAKYGLDSELWCVRGRKSLKCHDSKVKSLVGLRWGCVASKGGASKRQQGKRESKSSKT